MSRRDLADKVSKRQIVVPLPILPLGPTSVVVTDAAGAEVAYVDDASFTVASEPVALPADYGTWRVANLQAAVGRDGTTYLSLDLSAVQRPMVFEAQAVGLPLRFTGADIVFHNVQGFLMQRLVGNGEEQNPIPGMFVFPESATEAATDSDILHYSRHEFSTYFLQHQERRPHAVDGADGNWHLDGTPHVDHDHLIVAITGRNNDGSLPTPGESAPFDLVLQAYSLFSQGIVGVSEVKMSKSSRCDAYDWTTGTNGRGGDVFSNGRIELKDTATIDGDAIASKISRDGQAKITGQTIVLKTPTTFMEVKVPPLVEDLGTINLTASSGIIMGPGSFKVKDLKVTDGGTLFVDNSAGPVTVYVTGQVSISDTAAVVAADPEPENFAIYVASNGNVSLSGGRTRFFGVVYAPRSTLQISGKGELVGAFVGQKIDVSDRAQIHYDKRLRGPLSGAGGQ